MTAKSALWGREASHTSSITGLVGVAQQLKPVPNERLQPFLRVFLRQAPGMTGTGTFSALPFASAGLYTPDSRRRDSGKRKARHLLREARTWFP